MLSNNIAAMPCSSLTKPDNLQRTANRVRQQMHPEEPTDLEFELAMDHIPEDYLQGDISVRPRRHLLFATADQLDKLATARRWYIDGTFHIIRAPFTQPVSIHTFLQQKGEVKQVPLVFVLMTGKTSKLSSKCC